MKTLEEVEKKYEELNQRMRKQLPNDNDIKDLQNYMNKTIPDDQRTAIMLKIMSKPVDTISIDAQRYALEWVMGHYD